MERVETRDDGRYYPVFVCDHCGTRIDDARGANYVYAVDTHGMPVTGVIMHVHKRCDRAFRRNHPVEGAWYWGELQHLLVRLSANVQLDWERAFNGAALLGRL